MGFFYILYNNKQIIMLKHRCIYKILFILKFILTFFNLCAILVTTKGADDMDLRSDARMFKALADENRLSILRVLQGGEKCACVLLEELSITQPTLSHHMKLLCDSGIVNYRKEGKWMHYSISSEGREKLIELIGEYMTTSDEESSCCCSQ